MQCSWTKHPCYIEVLLRGVRGGSLFDMQRLFLVLNSDYRNLPHQDSARWVMAAFLQHAALCYLMHSGADAEACFRRSDFSPYLELPYCQHQVIGLPKAISASERSDTLLSPAHEATLPKVHQQEGSYHRHSFPSGSSARISKPKAMVRS